jgi:hypothetical protein
VERQAVIEDVKNAHSDVRMPCRGLRRRQALGVLGSCRGAITPFYPTFWQFQKMGDKSWVFVRNVLARA